MYKRFMKLIKFVMFCFFTLVVARLSACSWQSDRIRQERHIDGKDNRYSHSSIHNRFNLLCFEKDTS